jgi:hypothetical protein
MNTKDYVTSEYVCMKRLFLGLLTEQTFRHFKFRMLSSDVKSDAFAYKEITDFFMLRVVGRPFDQDMLDTFWQQRGSAPMSIPL